METEIHREALLNKAIKNVSDIVTYAIEHQSSEKAVVVFDTENELTRILTDAYRTSLPFATFIDFSAHTSGEIVALFDAMNPRDLVVLIQSTDFRLNEFRIRIQLFKRKLKVIDHLHLSRNTPDSWETYINALAYDPIWFRGMGRRLKTVLEHTSTLRVYSDKTELLVTGGLEEPKLNVGDYTGMENIGGTFPIGEVFTEAKDLSCTHGSLMVYALADTDFHTAMYKPFQIDIKDGLVVGWDACTPQTFSNIITHIQMNERALVREIGFGLNRSITKEHYLKDITAFERMLGLHFSLGEKHTVYKKPGITPDKTRYHVDIFPVVTEVYADEVLIFKDGTFLV